ncbi:MAG: hypothetical protein U0L18_08960 [Acutalibacteraceae bacterium]|nr:hypothetical protein [Acutalibacteraceae bacterium]
MMDQEFKLKLKDTLVALESRLAALEHSVNNVILQGLRDAADEYADEENYNAFTATYGDSIGKYSDSMKVLCGDDFDLCKELYSALKEADGYGTEGFDEKALMEGKLKDIEEKLSKLKGPVEVEVEEKKEDSEDKSEEDEPSEEEIARIYKEYKGE